MDGARTLFEPCVSSGQCRLSDPLTRCVDSVCVCPLPYVVTPDARCVVESHSDPGALNMVLAAAPTATLLVTLLALGALYGCHRWRQRVHGRSSSLLAVAPGDAPAEQPSLEQSSSFVHQGTRVNRRFLLTLEACREYSRARRLGLPLHEEGERRQEAGACLFLEYTTVSSATALAAASDEPPRRWSAAGRSDGDAAAASPVAPAVHGT
ncbi:uncharacterized protein LOC144133767 [Amblyomma americanum]